MSRVIYCHIIKQLTLVVTGIPAGFQDLEAPNWEKHTHTVDGSEIRLTS